MTGLPSRHDDVHFSTHLQRQLVKKIILHQRHQPSKMGEKTLYTGGIGDYLFDLGRWASLPVQLIGYLPLTSRSYPSSSHAPNKTFKFTWASIPACFAAFLTAASFSWCFMYFWRYKEFRSFIQFKSPTESGAFNLMILATSLSGLYVKLFGLLHGKGYAGFWERTRMLLDHFNDSTDSKEQKPPPEFQAIRSSCKAEVLFMLIPATFHVLYFYILPIVNSIADDPNEEFLALTNTDTQVYIGLAYSYLFALLHVSNAIWMNFFIKIYSQCLLLLSDELKSLKKVYQDRHNLELVKPLPFPQPDRGNSYVDSRFPPLSLYLRGILDKLALVDQELSRFNDFFGTLLLNQVGTCVTNLLVYSFFACLYMGRGNWKDGFMEMIVPLYLYGKELLDMGTVAENLSAAADSVLISLAENVVLDNLSEEIFLRIQIVSTQLCTKPPVISARQFFTINRGLVTSVMSALATFLVVLVQFREQDDDDAKAISASATTAISTSIIINATTVPPLS